MKCKYCGGVAWFFGLSEKGLCSECEHLVNLDVDQRQRIISDNEKAAERTLDPHSKITKLDIVVRNLDALADYEKRGIETQSGSPSRRRDESRADLGRLILKTARTELGEVLSKVRKTPNAESKIRLLSDFRLKLSTYRARKGAAGEILALDRRVRDSIYRIRLNVFLDLAQRAQEKQQRKEARLLYLEALKCLKSTEKSSVKRSKQIARLEEKVQHLSGGT